MGIRFSKQIKIGNLLKLNISKSGISASIGKKGASINLGSKGTYLNLSPTALGVKGTGVSYRQKITGGYGDAIAKLTGTSTNKKTKNKEELEQLDTSSIDTYYKDLEAKTNIHKYADNVLGARALTNRVNDFETEANRQIYTDALNGDENTIESLVGAFMGKLDLAYKVKCNYELEDHTLYVDLDLPEIEDFEDTYPTIVKNEIIYKKKAANCLKEEYANTVISLGIYLSANFFNITSYITNITLSAFTTRRDKNGDLKDEYLYSVKYTRDIFEKTDLKTIEEPLKFLLEFENRINVTSTNVLKAIKPFDMVLEEIDNTKPESLLDDVKAGLKELGYKVSDINKLLPELEKLNLKTSGEYLKEALKMLNNSK